MATRLTSVLIANRGEVAIRIARAAAEHGLRTVCRWIMAGLSVAPPRTPSAGKKHAWIDAW